MRPLNRYVIFISSAALLIAGLWFIGRSERFAIFLFPNQTDSLLATVTGHGDEKISVRLITGPNARTTMELRDDRLPSIDPHNAFQIGERVVLAANTDFKGDPYYITDRYRLPELAIITLIFIGTVLLFGRLRGLTSLFGLAATILILLFFVAPLILDGHNPLLVSSIAAGIIAILSLYLAHGFNIQTTIALISTLTTLIVSIGLTTAAVGITRLVGNSGDEAFFLRLTAGNINLSGILLAGIIIGTLGILDDITVGQTTVIQELKRANPLFAFNELYTRALIVGREHIASLVNTLVLAYAGASFPLFLLIIATRTTSSTSLVINSELIAEEIVRTLIGSLALIIAVPLTTFCAAYWYGKKSQ